MSPHASARQRAETVEGRVMATTSAVDMAKQAGIDPKRFRKALRDEHFSWHDHNDRWTVDIGSEQHVAMERVLRKLSN
jgi:hypothetical protein